MKLINSEAFLKKIKPQVSIGQYSIIKNTIDEMPCVDIYEITDNIQTIVKQGIKMMINKIEE